MLSTENFKGLQFLQPFFLKATGEEGCPFLGLPREIEPGEPPAIDQPHVNFEELGPQEEGDSEAFEEENVDRTLSGFFPPQ